MWTLAITLGCGILFGLGLIISGMVQPAKVLNFLDVAGTWDPSLLVVMIAALAVTSVGYWLARQRQQPLYGSRYSWPTNTDIDPPLIVGSGLFGVGWGLVGLCPGPAIVDLMTLSPQILVFVIAMTVGMLAHDLWRESVLPLRPEGITATTATDG